MYVTPYVYGVLQFVERIRSALWVSIWLCSEPAPCIHTHAWFCNLHIWKVVALVIAATAGGTDEARGPGGEVHGLFTLNTAHTRAPQYGCLIYQAVLVCLYIYVYTYMCVYIYTYAYIHIFVYSGHSPSRLPTNIPEPMRGPLWLGTARIYSRSPPGRLKEVWAHTPNEQRSSVLAQVTAI
jgi:hypothetical protein